MLKVKSTYQGLQCWTFFGEGKTADIQTDFNEMLKMAGCKDDDKRDENAHADKDL